MCVFSKALTSYPFRISSSRHLTCPPSAAEWMGFWPERRIARFVVMGMRVLRILQIERGGRGVGVGGGLVGGHKGRERGTNCEKQMLIEENRTSRKMFIRLWFELQCCSVTELQNSDKQKALCGNHHSENTAELEKLVSV